MELSELNSNRPPNEKANVWKTRLNTSLDTFFAVREPTRELFVDILLTNGILDHIAPTDLEEIAARKAEQRPVWDKSRDDPHLYWKILYSAAAAKEAVEKQWSVVADNGSYVRGIFPGIYEAINNGIFAKLYPEATKSKQPAIFVLDDIIDKVKQELEMRNQSTVGHPIKCGLKGEWRGVKGTIDRYSGDGAILLYASSYDDHTRLYDKTKENRGGIMPWEIDPSSFK